MRDIITVTKCTIKDMVKRKSFIISTLIILILIIIGFNVPNIIKFFAGEDTGNKLLIVDNDNIFEGNLELLKQSDLGYEIEIGEESFDEIKEKIENEEIDEAIMIEKQENNIKIRYIVKNTTIMSDVPETIVNSINSLYSNIQINKLGLTEEQIKSITPNFELSVEQTSEEKAKGNVYFQVPTDATSITLEYGLNIFTSSKVIFKVK